MAHACLIAVRGVGFAVNCWDVCLACPICLLSYACDWLLALPRTLTRGAAVKACARPCAVTSFAILAPNRATRAVAIANGAAPSRLRPVSCAVKVRLCSKVFPFCGDGSCANTTNIIHYSETCSTCAEVCVSVPVCVCVCVCVCVYVCECV